jgi:hypothetical protein
MVIKAGERRKKNPGKIETVASQQNRLVVKAFVKRSYVTVMSLRITRLINAAMHRWVKACEKILSLLSPHHVDSRFSATLLQSRKICGGSVSEISDKGGRFVRSLPRKDLWPNFMPFGPDTVSWPWANWRFVDIVFDGLYGYFQ